jgi:aminopeptidase-like protein
MATTVGEPFLSKHGWKNPNKATDDDTDLVMNALAYSTWQYDCEDIAVIIGCDLRKVQQIIEQLHHKNLIEYV